MSKGKEKEPEEIAIIYLQTFATPGGIEVLADLRKMFDCAWYPSCGLTLEMHAGARMVTQHIVDKMKCVSKEHAADVVYKADCI